MAMRKRADATEFAIYVRNVTAVAVKLEIPLGRVEREPTMSDDNIRACSRDAAPSSRNLSIHAASAPAAVAAASPQPVDEPVDGERVVTEI